MRAEAAKPPPNRFLEVGGARYDITVQMIDAFGTRFFAAKYTSQKGGYWKAPLLSTSKPRGGGGVRRFFTPDYTYPS